MTACQTTAACSANPSGFIVAETAQELREAEVTGDCAAVEAALIGITDVGIGGGKFYYDAANTDPDDNATILVSTTVGAWVKHSA